MKRQHNRNKRTELEEIIKPSSRARKPSRVTSVPWLWAYRRKGNYPENTVNCGKWLVFVEEESTDEAWEKIKKATENGELGGSAKVATAAPSPYGQFGEKVICVYTYDWTDEADVMRIREALRKLGVDWRIPYKTDKDTLNGKYSVTGFRKISKYNV